MIKETHIIRGTIYSLEELAEISDGVRVREKEEKEMTKAMEKMVGRIYEELTKWCTERGVVYEYHYSTDDGESCTFITSDTTLTVNHVENRDPEQFSRYVKSVLFGVDDIIIDHLKAQVDELKKEIVSKDDCIAYLQCELNYMGGDAVSRKSLSNQISQLEEEIEDKDAYIGRLEKEDIEKAKDIVYLEDELKKLRNENTGLKYQLDIMNTKILELNDTVSERDKNLRTAADKIIQITCANTSLKGQIDGLRYSLNKEREGYGELKERYDDRCKAYIEMCKWYDSARDKCDKAEEEINNLKAGRHDDTVDVTRYLVVLGKKKRAEEMIRSLKSQVEILEREKNELTNEYSDLVKVKEFVKDDTLKDIKERIAWILTHMNNAETEADKRFKKLEEAGGRTIGIDLNPSEVMKDIKERITKLENGTIFTNDMLTGICARLDKIEKPSEIELNLREVKKDIKEKQELIDALNSLDQRIAWMEDHMGSNENDVARSIEKIGEELRRVDNELIHVFNRINKLEDAQPKESAKKTSKKTQKSDLS